MTKQGNDQLFVENVFENDILDIRQNSKYKWGLLKTHGNGFFTYEKDLPSTFSKSEGRSGRPNVPQWKKAEIDLLKSLKLSPDDAYVINYLAYSWIEKGIKIKKSLEMLRKANRLQPNDGYIIDSLGWALFKLKNYKEAKQYLELASMYMASDPVVNDHYADSLWMNNKTLQARYYWNYVLKLDETEKKLKKEIEKKLLFGLKS